MQPALGNTAGREPEEHTLPAVSLPSSDLALFPVVRTQLCSQRAGGPVGAEPEVFSWGTEKEGGR